MNEHKSVLVEANLALRDKNYAQAISLYQSLINEQPGLINLIAFNLNFAKQKLLNETIDVNIPVTDLHNLLNNVVPEICEDKILKSGLFDKDFYLTTNYLGNINNPIVHYAWLGWELGYDPSKHFSTKGYLLAYPEVVSDKINPLTHYVTIGRARAYKPVSTKSKLPTSEIMANFDISEYLDLNEDVRNSSINPRWHFVAQGFSENRQCKRKNQIQQMSFYYDYINQQNNSDYNAPICQYQ